MSSSTPRPRAGTEEIVARFEASAEATALLTPGLGASDFVAALVEKELWSDAAGFVGQWLGKRDAVTWACLASRKALGEAPPPKERAALEAAERWLAAPDEPSRRACEAAAEALGYRSAPAMAAAAAFWSGGSLSLPDLPKVAAGRDPHRQGGGRLRPDGGRRRGSRRGRAAPRADLARRRHRRRASPSRRREMTAQGESPLPAEGGLSDAAARRPRHGHARLPHADPRRSRPDPARRRTDPSAGLPDGPDRRAARGVRRRHGRLRRATGRRSSWGPSPSSSAADRRRGWETPARTEGPSSWAASTSSSAEEACPR